MGEVTGTVGAADPDDDPLIYTVVESPIRGDLVLNADGTYSYTPSKEFAAQGGSETFRVLIAEANADDHIHGFGGLFAKILSAFFPRAGINHGSRIETTITVTVAQVNFAPEPGTPTVGAPDPETGSVTGTLGFSDPNPDDELTFSVTTDPLRGSVDVDESGNFTYTPNPEQRPAEGDDPVTDMFVVTAVDASAASATTAVIVSVAAFPNRPPIVGDPSFTIADVDTETGAITGAVHVTDSDGDTLGFTIKTGVDSSDGTVAIDSATGEWTFTPTTRARLDALATEGADTVDFTVSASDGHSNVELTVTAEIVAIAYPAGMVKRNNVTGDIAVKAAASTTTYDWIGFNPDTGSFPLTNAAVADWYDVWTPGSPTDDLTTGEVVYGPGSVKLDPDTGWVAVKSDPDLPTGEWFVFDPVNGGYYAPGSTVETWLDLYTSATSSPGFTIASIDPGTGVVVGTIDRTPQGGEITYSLNEPVGVDVGHVEIDSATGAWTFAPAAAALLRAWGTTEPDTAAFVVDASDGVTSVTVEVPVGVTEDALIAVLERVGSQPSGVVVGNGGRVYVINAGANTLSVLDPVDGSMTTVAVGRNPSDVAVAADGTVWVANTGDHSVSVLGQDGSYVNTVAVGVAPTAVAVADTGMVYVVNYGSNSVSVIDSTDHLVAQTIGDIGAEPVDLAMGPDGKVYVTNSGDASIAVIDPNSGYATNTIEVGTEQPHGIAVLSDGTIYVTHPYHNLVTILTPDSTQNTPGLRTLASFGITENTAAATGEINTSFTRTTVTVLDSPSNITTDFANRVFITNSRGDTIAVLGPHTQSAIAVGRAKPENVFYDDAGNLYLTHGGSNTLTVINTENGITRTYDVGVNTAAVSIVDGKVVLTSTYDGTTTTLSSEAVVSASYLPKIIRVYGQFSPLAVSADGNRLYATQYVPGSDPYRDIVVINPATNTVTKLFSFEPGVRVGDIAVNGDETRLYAAQYETVCTLQCDEVAKIVVVNLASPDQPVQTIELNMGSPFTAAYSLAMSGDGTQLFVVGERIPVDGDAEYREDQGIFPFFGTIWTVNIADDANSVSRAVTPEALRNEGTIGKPVVSPAADKRVYFVSSGVSTDYPKLGIFHPSTGDISTVDITDIGPYGLHDLVVSPDGTRVYTNSGHVFDTGGTPVLLEDRLQASGYRITASPSGHQLYVFDNGVMTVLDSDTGSRVGDPVFLAINSAIVSRSGTLYTSVWGDAPAPTSVQTLWETLQEFAQGNDDSGGIYIQTVRDNEGDNRMIVYLGGTDDFWGGGNQGVAENGPTAALRAVKDDQRERIQKAVSDCERSAQCGSIAEIMIVGYSQGGMDAQNLAREQGLGASVSTIVTFGSPIIDNPTVTTLHIQDKEDEIVTAFAAISDAADSLVHRALFGDFFGLFFAGKAVFTAATKTAEDRVQIFQGDASTGRNLLNAFQVHGDPQTYKEIAADFDAPSDDGFAEQRSQLQKFLGGTAILLPVSTSV